MSDKRRKFAQDFKGSAVRIALESGRPVAEIAQEVGCTRARWRTGCAKARVSQQREALGESERDERKRKCESRAGVTFD